MRLSRILALVCLAAFTLGVSAADHTAQITLLHWNDFHAQNIPFTTTIEGMKIKVGGAAYLAGLLDSLRRAMPGPIALDAGDEFTGTPISALTKGESQILLLNRIKPEAFEIGNHEFDYGWPNLMQRLEEADFPVLCCNLLDSASGKPVARPSLVLKVNGVKVGLIGVILPSLKNSVLPGSVPGLKVADPVPIVNKLLDSLAKVTDIQVALAHEGTEDDQRLAQGCPRLDVIVGGHRHAVLFDPIMVGNTYILQAGSKGQYLGVFQALVDTSENRVVSATERLFLIESDSLTSDPAIAALVDSLEKTSAAGLDTVLGTLTEPWVRNDTGESNVGDWTADAMIRLTGRQIAFLNSGGLRRDLPAGPVKARDLWELNPFGNRLMGFTLSGAELERIVKFQAEHGRDLLQVGGLRYSAQRSNGKIKELTVGGAPVDTSKQYTVVANEYVTGHPEKFFGFALGNRTITDLGWTDRDLAIKAFTQAGTVTSRKDGRIELSD